MSIENELTSGRSEALQILSHPGKPCAKVLRSGWRTVPTFHESGLISPETTATSKNARLNPVHREVKPPLIVRESTASPGKSRASS
jgi:hypothetical protein